MSVLAISSFIAILTTTVGLIPQILKTAQTRSAEDLSTAMIVNFILSSLAWMIYAVEIQSMTVFLSNVLVLITGVILFVQKNRYK